MTLKKSIFYRIILLIILTNLLISSKAQSKWNWYLNAGISQNSGNVENFSLKNESEVKRNDSIFAFMANYKFVYQKEKKEETNKGINGCIKFDFFQYDKWSPFVAMEAMSNIYKGYDLKVSGLTGAKLRIYHKNDTCDYSISAAIVYDYSDYYDQETLLDKNTWRLSLRPKIYQKITDVFAIKHTTFYQPRLSNFKDYYINSKTVLENKISKKLYINISFCYEYRSMLPTIDYSHNDIATDVALEIKF